MATKLIKNISRELLAPRRGSQIICALEPGDMISFRLKGRRRSYQVSLAHCFNLAILYTLEKEYQDKLDKYKKDKGLGLRRKRPTRSGAVFAPFYNKALSNQNQ